MIKPLVCAALVLGGLLTYPKPSAPIVVAAREVIEAKVGGPVAPDGTTEIHCDLPGDLHQQNTGGSDGAGLCVYASARHAGRWQNEKLFDAIFTWMKRHPGGSWPEKFDRTLKQCAKELNIPVPDYIQITDSRDLEILKLACRTGRMPGVTYGRSPSGRYNGQSIAHMVSLSHADDKFLCILDNNYLSKTPATPDNYEWMTPQEFLRVCNPNGYWAVILLTPPPPPPPFN